MTRAEYLARLNAELSPLPNDERDGAMRYYVEYFDEAGEDNQQRVIAELGSPEQLAKTLLSETPLQRAQRTGRINVWKIVTMVLLAPFWLPLAAGAFALLLGLIAVAFAALLCVGVAGMVPVIFAAGLCLSGISAVLSGFAVVFESFPTMLVMAGAGLVMLSLGALIIKPCALLVWQAGRLIGRGMRGIVGWLGSIFRRRRKIA